MILSDTAEAAHRVASGVMYGGAGMSAGSGASMAVTKYFGLLPGEWQVIGILFGIAIGLVGLLANTSINVYFKSRELKLMQKRLGVE